MKTVFEIKASADLTITTRAVLTCDKHTLTRDELASRRERFEKAVFKALQEEFGYGPREIKIVQ